MKNVFKAVLASALLAPALVACAGDNIVEYTNPLGGEMMVNCTKGTVKVLNDDEAPQEFMTPEKLSAESVKLAVEQGNPFAAIAGPIVLGVATEAVESACSAK